MPCWRARFFYYLHWICITFFLYFSLNTECISYLLAQLYSTVGLKCFFTTSHLRTFLHYALVLTVTDVWIPNNHGCGFQLHGAKQNDFILATHRKAIWAHNGNLAIYQICRYKHVLRSHESATSSVKNWDSMRSQGNAGGRYLLLEVQAICRYRGVTGNRYCIGEVAHKETQDKWIKINATLARFSERNQWQECRSSELSTVGSNKLQN